MMLVKEVAWSSHSEQLMKIRNLVFVQEQQVPAELEMDSWDESSTHFLVTHPTESQYIACARLLPNGFIGRMAVLKEWRRQGVGSLLLQSILEIAWKQSRSMVFLHAQTQALSFYESMGFEKKGEEFMEAGISHFQMEKKRVKDKSIQRVNKREK